MSFLGKSITKCIQESASSEDYECDNQYDDSVASDFEDEFDDLEELEDDMEYDEEMIPVVYQESTQRFLVEFDQLHKLMESKNMDEKEAMESLAEHNNIDMDKFYLVIESTDFMEEIIQEAKTSKKKTKNGIGVLKDHTNFLKNVKNKGLKVLKKRSKKGKKRK